MLALLCAPLDALATRAYQRDLAALHDSVQRIEDAARLRALLAERGPQAARSPELLTERGLIGWRLYEVTSKRADATSAQRAFEEALRQAPNYGWAHYGLGRALARGPGSNPHAGGARNAFVLDDALARVFGADAPTRARRAFLKAVNGEPPVPQAAAELAQLATMRWRRETVQAAADALTELNGSPHATAQSWLSLAQVQLELDQPDAAEVAVDKALALGGDPALSERTRALVLFHNGKRDAGGAAAWLASVAHATGETLELLFSDVEPLLNQREIAQWHQLDPVAQREFLQNFWDVRAALAGVSVAERIGEHYRRVAYARRHYWRNVRYGAPTNNHLLMRSYGNRPYDDRGLIYIRHGQPLDRLRGNGPGESRESWVYRDIEAGPRMLHFAAMQSQGDLDLVHTLPCDADYIDVNRTSDATLARLLVNCSPMNRAALSAEYRQYAFKFVETDSDAPDFVKDLPFYFDLYTFRGEAGRTNVVAAVAVPVEKLQKTVHALNPSYRVDLSLILVDTASRKVIRQDDSVALAATRAFKNDDLFRMHVEVAVPPSRTTVQRVIVSDPSEPGIGQLYGGPFPIPDYSEGKLMLSDVVLAEPRVEGRWRRGNVALALVPTGRFKGGSFRVFYEIYNIEKNSAYSTEIEIEPVQRSAGRRIKDLFGGKSKISLKFEGVALDVQDGALQELRQVDAPLSPGKYRMRITVRDAAGEVAKGERMFVVPED